MQTLQTGSICTTVAFISWPDSHGNPSTETIILINDVGLVQLSAPNSLFFAVLGDSGETPVQCFLSFFMDLSSKTPSFESCTAKKPHIIDKDDGLSGGVAMGSRARK